MARSPARQSVMTASRWIHSALWAALYMKSATSARLRTYRRRVAELLAGLDAGSRFQAGVRAGGLGLTRG